MKYKTKCAIIISVTEKYGPLAQLGERQVRNLEVRGSIPLWSTITHRYEPDEFGYRVLCSTTAVRVFLGRRLYYKSTEKSGEYVEPMYIFDEPLIQGTMLKRKSRFTAVVRIGGEELIAHMPITNRIGDVENKNLPCLLSYHLNPKRKLHYDIEAVLLSDDDNWVGINQILSNRLVEHFFREHKLDKIVSEYDDIQREVKLGISKLDFRVGDTYLEVKTPLTTINVKYGENIKTLPPKSFSSTDRMVKHVNELTGSLSEHERAIFLQVFQYRITERKERLRSTHYEEVSKTIHRAVAQGVEFWEIQMDFRPEGVSLYSVERSTDL